MEKRLPLILFFSIFVFLRANLNPIFAQNLNQDQKIQILLWAEKEAFPGFVWNEEEKNLDLEKNENALPVNRLKKTAPFFVQGMLYGWKVEYTPYDKARGVKEYLNFEPVQELTQSELNSIQYKNPAFKDDRLYCRVEFDRSEFQQNLYKSWQTVKNPRIRGVGYGKLQDGFAGIEQACAEAIKNAIREYWRAQIKNKPKEIESRLLICCAPVIGVEAGRYRVMLDFFMETDRILNYEMF